MTEVAIGGWHDYTWSGGGITVASTTGVLGLGFALVDGITVASFASGEVSIGGCDVSFNVIDLTEPDAPINDTKHKNVYRGGIQSVDKGFSSTPVNIPIPTSLAVGYDIGFVDSAVITIAGVWMDGLYGRDMYLEDLRTTKKLVDPQYKASPFILVLSGRAYPVLMTGYSSNLVGGQGNIISFRLGLQIVQLAGHYGVA